MISWVAFPRLCKQLFWHGHIRLSIDLILRVKDSFHQSTALVMNAKIVLCPLKQAKECCTKHYIGNMCFCVCYINFCLSYILDLKCL